MCKRNRGESLHFEMILSDSYAQATQDAQNCADSAFYALYLET